MDITDFADAEQDTREQKITPSWNESHPELYSPPSKDCYGEPIANPKLAQHKISRELPESWLQSS